jgi:hypothetical protein
MILLPILATSAIRKSPASPFVKGGQCKQKDFPSLKKHALSAVEGRG